MLLTFEELRKVKDTLPHGGLQKIADELGLDVQTVKNYFGADHYEHGSFAGAHFEPGGLHGGIVKLDDDKIYQTAMQLLEKQLTV